MRGVLSPETRLHLEINQVLLEHGPGPEVDAALARCPDAECRLCSILVCPEGDSMHFHHDGCPSCAERLVECEGCHGSGQNYRVNPFGGCTDCLGTGKRPA